MRGVVVDFRPKVPLISNTALLWRSYSHSDGVANIYYNQPMLGIIEAAFPGRAAITGMVPTATQLGFASGKVGLSFAGVTPKTCAS